MNNNGGTIDTMKKRVLALLLTLALVFASLPTVQAVETPHLVGSKVETNGYTLNNGTFVIDYNLVDLPQDRLINSLQFRITYDDTQLTFVRCEVLVPTYYNPLTGSNTERSPELNHVSGEFSYALASSYGLEFGAGDLLKLYFTVDDGVPYDTVCQFEAIDMELTLVPDGVQGPETVDGFYSDDGSIKVNPTVSFYHDSLLVGTVGYGSGATSVTPPAVPTVAIGCEGAWPTEYDLPITGGTKVYLNVNLSTYTATFVNESGNPVGTVEFNINSTLNDVLSQAPAVPQKAGYTAAWESFSLVASDFTVHPVYTPIDYTATFIDEDGETVGAVGFTVENSVAEVLSQAPAVPQKTGYIAAWESFTIVASNITVHPAYTPISYTATFVDEDGETVGTVEFTVESTVNEILAQAPEVPNKEGYTGFWEPFTVIADDITIHPSYSSESFVATFVSETGETVGTVSFTVEHSVAWVLTQAPSVPAKDGYSGAWEEFEIIADDIAIEPVYTLNTYTVTYVDEQGETIKAIDFTIFSTLNEVLAQAPAIPDKAHYTGVWEQYTLTSANIQVEPVYTAITYTVIFVADEQLVDSFSYTVETDLNTFVEPAVPQKEGYTGAWESYDLTDYESMTVNAVYTADVVYLYGDADCNGSVDAADAAYILRFVVRLNDMSEREKIQGNVAAPYDEHGPDAADAAYILRKVVRLIDIFPVEEGK